MNAHFVKEFARLTGDAYRMGWHERNGGNLSYRIKPEEIEEVKGAFMEPGPFVQIGTEAVNLAGEHFLVTGSGRFFRNIARDPEKNTGIIQVDDTGSRYRLLWGLRGGGVPTSELPAHLISHAVKKETTGNRHRVILHSHTTNLIALTFVLPLDDGCFTRALWEIATECPVVFPAGVGVVKWMVPGGRAIAEVTGEMMRDYDIVIWAYHGTFCSGEDFDEAFGLMETVEKSAEILVKVMSMGGMKQRMSSDDIRCLARDFRLPLRETFLSPTEIFT